MSLDNFFVINVGDICDIYDIARMRHRDNAAWRHRHTARNIARMRHCDKATLPTKRNLRHCDIYDIATMRHRLITRDIATLRHRILGPVRQEQQTLSLFCDNEYIHVQISTRSLTLGDAMDTDLTMVTLHPLYSRLDTTTSIYSLWLSN